MSEFSDARSPMDDHPRGDGADTRSGPKAGVQWTLGVAALTTVVEWLTARSMERFSWQQLVLVGLAGGLVGYLIWVGLCLTRTRSDARRSLGLQSKELARIGERLTSINRERTEDARRDGERDVKLAESSGRIDVVTKSVEALRLEIDARLERFDEIVKFSAHEWLEAQQLASKIELAILDRDGRVASLSSDLIFVAKTAEISELRWNLSGGNITGAKATLERYSGVVPFPLTPEVNDRLTGRWEPCPSLEDVGQAQEPFTQDYSCTIPAGLIRRNNLYRQSLKARVTDAFTEREEHFDHRFDRELSARVILRFHAEYGHGVVSEWRENRNLPKAFVRHRFRPHNVLNPRPTKLDDGGVQFEFSLEPKAGDRLLVRWTTHRPRPGSGGAPSETALQQARTSADNPSVTSVPKVPSSNRRSR